MTFVHLYHEYPKEVSVSLKLESSMRHDRSHSFIHRFVLNGIYLPII
jgi:hypothetical protein